MEEKMKEYCETIIHWCHVHRILKNMIYIETEYHWDNYASNLKLYYLLTSVTTRTLRRAVGSLLHGPRPIAIRPQRRAISSYTYIIVGIGIKNCMGLLMCNMTKLICYFCWFIATRRRWKWTAQQFTNVQHSIVLDRFPYITHANADSN